MSKFTVRVELFGMPSADDYTKLHSAMESKSFSRRIKQGETTFMLPTAEYIIDSANIPQQIMDNAKITATPKIVANHIDASLIHEAAIGKIAGEQLIKLMTLGLTEKEAEEQIISGFLK